MICFPPKLQNLLYFALNDTRQRNYLSNHDFFIYFKCLKSLVSVKIKTGGRTTVKSFVNLKCLLTLPEKDGSPLNL